MDSSKHTEMNTKGKSTFKQEFESYKISFREQGFNNLKNYLLVLNQILLVLNVLHNATSPRTESFFDTALKINLATLFLLGVIFYLPSSLKLGLQIINRYYHDMKTCLLHLIMTLSTQGLYQFIKNVSLFEVGDNWVVTFDIIAFALLSYFTISWKYILTSSCFNVGMFWLRNSNDLNNCLRIVCYVLFIIFAYHDVKNKESDFMRFYCEKEEKMLFFCVLEKMNAGFFAIKDSKILYYNEFLTSCTIKPQSPGETISSGGDENNIINFIYDLFRNFEEINHNFTKTLIGFIEKFQRKIAKSTVNDESQDSCQSAASREYFEQNVFKLFESELRQANFSNFTYFGTVKLEEEKYYEMSLRISQENNLEFFLVDISRVRKAEKAKFEERNGILSKFINHLKYPLTSIEQECGQLNEFIEKDSDLKKKLLNTKKSNISHLFKKLKYIERLSKYIRSAIQDLESIINCEFLTNQTPVKTNIDNVSLTMKLQDALGFSVKVLKSVKEFVWKMINIKIEYHKKLPNLLFINEFKLQEILINMLNIISQNTRKGLILIKIKPVACFSNIFQKPLKMIRFTIRVTGTKNTDHHSASNEYKIVDYLLAQMGSKLYFKSKDSKENKYWFDVENKGYDVEESIDKSLDLSNEGIYEIKDDEDRSETEMYNKFNNWLEAEIVDETLETENKKNTQKVAISPPKKSPSFSVS